MPGFWEMIGNAVSAALLSYGLAGILALLIKAITDE